MLEYVANVRSLDTPMCNTSIEVDEIIGIGIVSSFDYTCKNGFVDNGCAYPVPIVALYASDFRTYWVLGNDRQVYSRYGTETVRPIEVDNFLIR